MSKDKHLSDFLSGTISTKTAGDLAISQRLRKKIEGNQSFKRKYVGQFKIDDGIVVEGSFRKGGHCPDVLFEDFELGAEINPQNPKQTFIEKCRSLQGNPESKIDALLDLVITLITKKTIKEGDKTFYGVDYHHPYWQSEITKSYRDKNEPMPIKEFVRLGFGDCRIVNGLLAFGLNHCGIDTRYSYKSFFVERKNLESGNVTSETLDHAACIVKIDEKRYLVDANVYRYNGHSIEKLVRGNELLTSHKQDLKVGTSDLYQWRKTITRNSGTINPDSVFDRAYIKRTHNFPEATIEQPAVTPYGTSPLETVPAISPFGASPLIAPRSKTK